MTYEEEVKLSQWEAKARMLALVAAKDGVVITITQRPTQPLRMGGYTSVAEVRLIHTNK